MKDLLLCAIHRAGMPLTAAEVQDRAIALGVDAGWPNHHLPTSVAKISAALRNLARTGWLVEDEPRKVEGNLRPTYRPRGGEYVTGMETPDPPSDEPKQHPVTTLSQHQQIVLFDSFQAMLEAYARQAGERQALDKRHADEMSALWERWRGRLTAAGLDR